jgi:hypothetical protein
MARSASCVWWLGMGVLMFNACIQPDDELPPEAYYQSTDHGVIAADGGSPATDGHVATPPASVAGPVDTPNDTDGGFGGVGGDPQPGGAKPDCVPSLVAAMREDLDECRQCHSPRGAAKKSDFVLEGDDAAYVAAVRAAYEVYGRDLLAIPAQEDGRRHTGGRWIAKGTALYATWDALIRALENPGEGCN